MKARTSGGSIRIVETGGEVDVSTSGGGISIERAGGNVRAHTSGGSIQVEEVFGAIEAVTSGGSINASISSQPASDCRLSTSGGSVVVRLAPTVAVDLDARSSGGGVKAEVPVTVQGSMDKNRLEGNDQRWRPGAGPEDFRRRDFDPPALSSRPDQTGCHPEPPERSGGRSKDRVRPDCQAGKNATVRPKEVRGAPDPSLRSG